MLMRFGATLVGVGVRQPTDQFVTVIDDSRRWASVEMRPDDIIISTPPKSGTTWTQGIVSALLWPAGDAPGSLFDRTAWVDVRFNELDELREKLDGMQHRRFIKTHSPADCVPFDDRLSYVVTYRDGRDAFMSWLNHRATMRWEAVEVANARAAADGVRPWHRYEGDEHRVFAEWQEDCNPIRHLASWWPRRHLDNVIFLHYADLKADTEGELRRLAEFLELPVADEHWPRVLDEVSIDSMRSSAAETGRMNFLFDGGAESFFHQGTNGRWVGRLDDEILTAYDEMVAALPSDAADWLAHGSLAIGCRPHEFD
jgi:aryl sulfotransferase